jgi:hypothetical protein
VLTDLKRRKKELHVHFHIFLVIYNNIYTHIHTYIRTYIPRIHKFVTATIGCGISHKDIKHTDKCQQNKNNTEKNYETADKYFFLKNTVKIPQKV